MTSGPGAAASRVLACSLREAQQRLGDPPDDDRRTAPSAARRLAAAGEGSVCIVGTTGARRTLHWLETEHARGWLAPGGGGAGESGTSELFATHLEAAIGKGYVVADAAVLATMATSATQVGRMGPDFVNDPALLPQLSWGEEQPRPAEPHPAGSNRRLDLYAIVDSAERLLQVLDAGVRTVQLRIKTPPTADALWHATLRHEVQRSMVACDAAGAELFVNDHWQLAQELGAYGVHLGQEDLLALGDDGRTALLATGLALGVSSHSLWELCRARTMRPRYIACGPVWPTLTKAMPWRPQGLDNLVWWCRMAQVPVVAIGGVLGPQQVMDAARCGADGVCVVRGLGDEPARVLPSLQAALDAGRRQHEAEPIQPGWPHPSLSADLSLRA